MSSQRQMGPEPPKKLGDLNTRTKNTNLPVSNSQNFNLERQARENKNIDLPTINVRPDKVKTTQSQERTGNPNSRQHQRQNDVAASKKASALTSQTQPEFTSGLLEMENDPNSGSQRIENSLIKLSNDLDVLLSQENENLIEQFEQTAMPNIAHVLTLETEHLSQETELLYQYEVQTLETMDLVVDQTFLALDNILGSVSGTNPVLKALSNILKLKLDTVNKTIKEDLRSKIRKQIEQLKKDWDRIQKKRQQHIDEIGNQELNLNPGNSRTSSNRTNKIKPVRLAKSDKKISQALAPRRRELQAQLNERLAGKETLPITKKRGTKIANVETDLGNRQGQFIYEQAQDFVVPRTNGLRDNLDSPNINEMTRAEYAAVNGIHTNQGLSYGDYKKYASSVLSQPATGEGFLTLTPKQITAIQKEKYYIETGINKVEANNVKLILLDIIVHHPELYKEIVSRAYNELSEVKITPEQVGPDFLSQLNKLDSVLLADELNLQRLLILKSHPQLWYRQKQKYLSRTKKIRDNNRNKSFVTS